MALLISSLYKQNKRAASAALYINRIKILSTLLIKIIFPPLFWSKFSIFKSLTCFVYQFLEGWEGPETDVIN